MNSSPTKLESDDDIESMQQVKHNITLCLGYLILIFDILVQEVDSFDSYLDDTLESEVCCTVENTV